jgi:hypothetical protein
MARKGTAAVKKKVTWYYSDDDDDDDAKLPSPPKATSSSQDQDGVEPVVRMMNCNSAHYESLTLHASS